MRTAQNNHPPQDAHTFRDDARGGLGDLMGLLPPRAPTGGRKADPVGLRRGNLTAGRGGPGGFTGTGALGSGVGWLGGSAAGTLWLATGDDLRRLLVLWGGGCLCWAEEEEPGRGWWEEARARMLALTLEPMKEPNSSISLLLHGDGDEMGHRGRCNGHDFLV